MRPLAGLLLAAALPLLGQDGFTLPSGLAVRLFENHERPYLEARLEVSWEPREEAGLEGAGAFLGAVLEAGGAGPYAPGAWRRALDDQGILLRFEAGPGRYTWTLQCPSSSQEAAFTFLAHAVARPLLDGPGVEAQRARLQREGQRRTPAAWAEERFRLAFLEGRPGALLSGTRAGALSLEQLQAFQARVLRPGRARLALHGDLNPAQARQLALLHLGVWGPAAVPPTPEPAPGPPQSGLAIPQGRPEARLAILAPGSGEETRLLALLLHRWLQEPGPPEREGRLLATGQGPCLLLQAAGPAGADPLQLLADLRAWAGALAARPLGEEDLALALRLRRSREAAAALHPSRQLEEAFEPAPPQAAATPRALQAALARWLAPDRMRVLLLGLPALPKEPPALQGLPPLAAARPGD